MEVLAAQSGEKPYLLAAAYADNAWLPGQELTGKEFSDALKRVKGQVI